MRVEKSFFFGSAERFLRECADFDIKVCVRSEFSSAVARENISVNYVSLATICSSIYFIYRLFFGRVRGRVPLIAALVASRASAAERF